MSVLHPDTSPEAERVLVDLLRKASPRRKMEMVAQLNETVRTLVLQGLRRRRPDATEEQLHRALADILLGPDLAKKAYSREGRRAVAMTADPIAIALLVVDALEGLGVRYLIAGSMASSLHGSARMSHDVDLIAELCPPHAGPLTRALESSFYIDETAILDAVKHRGIFNALHWDTFFKVDVFVPPDRPFDRTRFERGILEPLGDDPHRRVFISSAEDTILAKLEWYRMGNEVSDMQWKDVTGILQLQKDHLNWTLLRHWAGELEVEDLLERALSEISKT